MLRNIGYSSMILIGTASMAFAAGVSEPTMEPVPIIVAQAPVMVADDWTGFYLGGGIGTGEVTFGTDTPLDSNDLSVHAGYMYDMGSIVVGGELEYERMDFKDTGDKFDASVLRLKGRVGYDAGPFLPYLTAGGARLMIEDGSDISDNGYFYGLGAEYAVNDNFRVGGEILQHEFEEFNDGDDVSAKTVALRVSYSF